jgi:hypothetical protein
MATVTESAILSPAAVEALLRECVTVVRPGETLIVRVPWGVGAEQVYKVGQYVHSSAEAMGAQFHTLVVPAESLGVGTTPDLTAA